MWKFLCQVIYTLPELDPELEKEMIDAPYETKSDSFYFMGNKMVMHNKVGESPGLGAFELEPLSTALPA